MATAEKKEPAGERLTTDDIARSSERPEIGVQAAKDRPGDPSAARAPNAPAVAGTAERADRGERKPGRPEEPANAPLFAPEESQGYRTRWDGIQTGFVDEPRRAVEEADALVAQIMKQLAEVFARERSELERQWDKGDRVSTEDLRVALRRYRSFFERLLKA